jgi:hypothetical protein
MINLINNCPTFTRNSWGFYLDSNPIAQQVRFLTPVILGTVQLLLAKNVSPTGTITIKVYASDLDFRNPDAKPTGAALASSSTSVDVSTLNDLDAGGDFVQVGFAFANNDELPAGVYFFVFEVANLDTQNGQVRVGRDATNWYVFAANNCGTFAWFDDLNAHAWMSCREGD